MHPPYVASAYDKETVFFSSLFSTQTNRDVHYFASPQIGLICSCGSGTSKHMTKHSVFTCDWLLRKVIRQIIFWVSVYIRVCGMDEENQEMDTCP